MQIVFAKIHAFHHIFGAYEHLSNEIGGSTKARVSSSVGHCIKLVAFSLCTLLKSISYKFLLCGAIAINP